MNQERGAAVALPRHSRTTLFYSFWGGEGKRKKTFEKPCRQHWQKSIPVFDPMKLLLSQSSLFTALKPLRLSWPIGIMGISRRWENRAHIRGDTLAMRDPYEQLHRIQNAITKSDTSMTDSLDRIHHTHGNPG